MGINQWETYWIVYPPVHSRPSPNKVPITLTDMALFPRQKHV